MTKGKLLAICVVWLTVVAIAAIAYRMLREDPEEVARRRTAELVEETTGTSRYRHTVRLAIDGFSGYAVIRSPDFRSRLADQEIRLQLNDDQANYKDRLQKLADGETELAVFTIDALVKATADAGTQPPAVIVSVVDETRGADAVLAAKAEFPNINALNQPQTRFVLTPDSPSETLARVMMTTFDLQGLGENPFVHTSGPEATVDAYRKAQPNSHQVYVLWEPFVSEILADDAMHVVADSSRFAGYIVDVIVARRDFLAEQPELVEAVLGCYFASAYHYRNEMVQLVRDDSRQAGGTPLSPEQAEKLVQGIRWKNTQENFAHFNIVHDGQRQYIEDMIFNITDVLQRTGAIAADPTAGKPALFYSESTLRRLRESNFHPAMSDETVDAEHRTLPALAENDWSRLRTVGNMDVGQLKFARSRSVLTGSSKKTLEALARKLETLPSYYVVVRGNAAQRGNAEKNRELAAERARVAAAYLIDAGVHANRVRAESGAPSGSATVTFILGEAPY